MPRAKNPELRLIAIRLRKRDLAVARKKARALGIPYQHVVRAWVAEAATAAR